MTTYLALMRLMRIPWQERTSTTLSDLYDADLRGAEPAVATIACDVFVPHPLTGVQYADGKPG